jgi:hypothetical protein
MAAVLTTRRWLLAAVALTTAALAVPAPSAGAAPAPRNPGAVEMTDLPAGFEPTDINDRGLILGRLGDDIVVFDDGGQPAGTVGPWEPFPNPLCPSGPICFWPSPSAPLLNDRGVVATSLAQRATLWDDGGTTDLNGDARGSWALDLNDRGQAVVTRFMTDHLTVGLWERGRFTEIGRWPLETAVVGRLSGRGHVVLTTVTVRPPAVTSSVLLWHRGVTTPVEGFAPAGIDDRGRLVGQTTGTATQVGNEPAVWDDGEITVLPTLGGDGPHGTSYVNGRGQIAGYSTPSGATEQSVVLWEDGEVVDVGASLGLRLVSLRGLSDRGQVLVGGYTAAFHTAGYVWDDGEVVRLPPGDGADVHPVTMNDRGQVVGRRRLPGPQTPSIPTLWEL